MEGIHLKKLARRKKIRSIVTNGMDFIPIIGSFKMIVEGLRGKQLMTKIEMKGIVRALHMFMGIVFLLLDITGIGAILSAVGKGAIKYSELLMLRKLEENLARHIVEEDVPHTYHELQETS